MKNHLFIHPHHAASPLARTTAMTMLVTIILAAIGFSWRLATPDPVQDRHIDGQLLQGLSWLSQALRQGETPAPYSEALPCDSSDNKILASRLEKIAAYWDGNAHLTLPQPDCNHISAVNKAARWLLNQDAEQIRAILRAPTENLVDLIVRRDPFRLPGCLFIHGASATTAPIANYCKDANGWQSASLSNLPPQSEALWANLAFYRQALRGQSPNTYHYPAAAETDMDTPFAQGRHQFLSLNADVQTKAQLTAACYSGDTASCALCPWCNTLGAAEMYEGARARMIGVLVVDTRNGGILAVGGNHSRCYAAQHSGNSLPADCPSLPTPPANRPWRLTNHALEQAVMPASLVKIPLAAALLEADIPAADRDAMIKDWLVRSDTEAFIDTVFCKDQDFQPVCAKKRLAGIRQMVFTLGWNRGCDGKNTTGCGQQDLLGAGLVKDLDYPVLTGRLLLDGNNAPLPVERLNLNINAIQACYKQGHEQRWRNCRGADFINTLAELYGQGSAMASPVGISQLLLQLTAAESGQAQAPVVHLLEQLDGKDKPRSIAPLQPLAMKPETAQAIVSAMAQTHLRGTAHAACLKAAQPGGLLRCQDGKDMPLRLAGKTGTPLFPADTLTLAKWREQCTQPPAAGHQSERQRHEQVRCKLSPFKWYGLLMGNPGSQGWDKAIIVLAERNWNQHTGFVDSVEDHGSNVAAEVGLALANALASPADTVWQPPVAPITPPSAVTANKAKPNEPTLFKGAHGVVFKSRPNQASLRYHHLSTGYAAKR